MVSDLICSLGVPDPLPSSFRIAASLLALEIGNNVGGSVESTRYAKGRGAGRMAPSAADAEDDDEDMVPMDMMPLTATAPACRRDIVSGSPVEVSSFWLLLWFREKVRDL